MTTYNTGNPIGSANVKDLYDNAENLDLAMNDRVPGWWNDRLGVKRPNIAMALQLASTGQVNVFYAPDRPAAEILAAGLGDGATVWIDRDAANGGMRTRNTVVGGALISPVAEDANRAQGFRIDNIAALRLYEPPMNGAVAQVTSYYAGWAALTSGPVGGGRFVWDAASTAADDGGSVIAVTGVAAGRWKRIFAATITTSEFGALGNGVADDYAATQAALTYCGQFPRPCQALQGSYMLSAGLVVPRGVIFFGDGMDERFSGTIYPATWFRAMDSFTSGDILRVAGQLFGSRRWWSGQIKQIGIRGNAAASAQWGVSFRDVDGNIVAAQDTTVIEDIFILGCKSGGIEMPNAALPITISRAKALWNDGPGIHVTGGANLHQSLTFVDVSGDGNNGGLLKFTNLDRNGSVTIVNLKSERRINQTYGSADHQANAIVFENCDLTPVTIVGATHVSSVPDGGNFKKPGDLVSITGAVAPAVSFSGVAIRVRAGDTGTDPAILTFGSLSFPCTKSSGYFGGSDSSATYAVSAPASMKHVVGMRATFASAGPMDNGYQAAGTTPGYSWHETDGAADAKTWSMEASSGSLRRRTINDAGAASIYETVSRSGGAATLIDWVVPVGPGLFTTITLPIASGATNRIAMVSNPAANKGRLVYSDGTNWRYVSDDSVV